MFCNRCGAQIPDGSSQCPHCGQNLAFNQAMNSMNNFFRQAEGQFTEAANDVRNQFNNNGGGRMPGQRLQTDRDIVMYIVLSIVTCGIYGYYFIYKMAYDVNIACYGDGQETGGLVQFILLSFVTCGIYAYYWYYCLGNRLQQNAPRYGLQFQENGTTILMWCIIGMVICGIGQFVGMYFLMKNTNAICDAYNRYNGLY